MNPLTSETLLGKFHGTFQDPKHNESVIYQFHSKQLGGKVSYFCEMLEKIPWGSLELFFKTPFNE